MQKEDNKKDNRRILIIIILLLIIMAIIIGIILLFRNSVNFVKTYSNDLESDKQVVINLKERETKNDEYTEIVGYGEIHLYEDYPYVYLINPENNTVYMKFDVLDKDKLLYSSGLISPGMMESFNAYEALDAGSHSLKYEISTYDINTKEQLMSGINQNQDVIIEK